MLKNKVKYLHLVRKFSKRYTSLLLVITTLFGVIAMLCLNVEPTLADSADGVIVNGPSPGAGYYTEQPEMQDFYIRPISSWDNLDLPKRAKEKKKPGPYDVELPSRRPGFDAIGAKAYTKARSKTYNGVATEEHIIITDNAVKFFGYGQPSMTDYVFDDGAALDGINFQINPASLVGHVTDKAGVLFNGKITRTGYYPYTKSYYTGYALMLINGSKNKEDAETSSFDLVVYYLKGVLLPEFNGIFGSGDNDSATLKSFAVMRNANRLDINSGGGYENIATIRTAVTKAPKGYASATPIDITLNVKSDRSFDIRAEWKEGTKTKENSIEIDATSPKFFGGADEIGFGFFASYVSHGCSQLSRISFEYLAIKKRVVPIPTAQRIEYYEVGTNKELRAASVSDGMTTQTFTVNPPTIAGYAYTGSSQPLENTIYTSSTYGTPVIKLYYSKIEVGKEARILDSTGTPKSDASGQWHVGTPDEPVVVNAGDQIEYRITVENNNPKDPYVKAPDVNLLNTEKTPATNFDLFGNTTKNMKSIAGVDQAVTVSGQGYRTSSGAGTSASGLTAWEATAGFGGDGKIAPNGAGTTDSVRKAVQRTVTNTSGSTYHPLSGRTVYYKAYVNKTLASARDFTVFWGNLTYPTIAIRNDNHPRTIANATGNFGGVANNVSVAAVADGASVLEGYITFPENITNTTIYINAQMASDLQGTNIGVDSYVRFDELYVIGETAVSSSGLVDGKPINITNTGYSMTTGSTSASGLTTYDVINSNNKVSPSGMAGVRKAVQVGIQNMAGTQYHPLSGKQVRYKVHVNKTLTTANLAMFWSIAEYPSGVGNTLRNDNHPRSKANSAGTIVQNRATVAIEYDTEGTTLSGSFFLPKEIPNEYIYIDAQLGLDTVNTALGTKAYIRFDELYIYDTEPTEDLLKTAEKPWLIDGQAVSFLTSRLYTSTSATLTPTGNSDNSWYAAMTTKWNYNDVNPTTSTTPTSNTSAPNYDGLLTSSYTSKAIQRGVTNLSGSARHPLSGKTVRYKVEYSADAVNSNAVMSLYYHTAAHSTANSTRNGTAVPNGTLWANADTRPANPREPTGRTVMDQVTATVANTVMYLEGYTKLPDDITAETFYFSARWQRNQTGTAQSNVPAASYATILELEVVDTIDISDIVPEGLTYVSGSASPSDATVTTEDGETTIAWEDQVMPDYGMSKTFTFKALVGPKGNFVNTANAIYKGFSFNTNSTYHTTPVWKVTQEFRDYNAIGTKLRDNEVESVLLGDPFEVPSNVFVDRAYNSRNYSYYGYYIGSGTPNQGDIILGLPPVPLVSSVTSDMTVQYFYRLKPRITIEYLCTETETELKPSTVHNVEYGGSFSNSGLTNPIEYSSTDYYYWGHAISGINKTEDSSVKTLIDSVTADTTIILYFKDSPAITYRFIEYMNPMIRTFKANATHLVDPGDTLNTPLAYMDPIEAGNGKTYVYEGWSSPAHTTSATINKTVPGPFSPTSGNTIVYLYFSTYYTVTEQYHVHDDYNAILTGTELMPDRIHQSPATGQGAYKSGDMTVALWHPTTINSRASVWTYQGYKWQEDDNALLTTPSTGPANWQVFDDDILIYGYNRTSAAATITIPRHYQDYDRGIFLQTSGTSTVNNNANYTANQSGVGARPATITYSSTSYAVYAGYEKTVTPGATGVPNTTVYNEVYPTNATVIHAAASNANAYSATVYYRRLGVVERFRYYNNETNATYGTLLPDKFVATTSGTSYTPSVGTPPTTLVNPDTGVTLEYYGYRINGEDNGALTNTSSLPPFTTPLITGITSGQTITYVYIQIVNVDFESHGGTAVASQKFMAGGTATEPTNPTKEGFAFGGWFTDDGTFLIEWDFATAVNADMILYAKWTEIPNITIYMRQVVLYPAGSTSYIPKQGDAKITNGTNITYVKMISGLDSFPNPAFTKYTLPIDMANYNFGVECIVPANYSYAGYCVSTAEPELASQHTPPSSPFSNAVLDVSVNTTYYVTVYITAESGGDVVIDAVTNDFTTLDVTP